MSGRKLAEHVILLSDAGESVTFAPGTAESDLPEWARARITNDAAWDGGEKQESSEDAGSPRRRSRS